MNSKFTKKLTSLLLMKCQWWQIHYCKTLKLEYGKLRMIKMNHIILNKWFWWVIMHNFHQYVIAICQTQNYCQKHSVYNAIDWNSVTFYTLETSIRHVEGPKYCFFYKHNPLLNTNERRNFISFEQFLHWWKLVD